MTFMKRDGVFLVTTQEALDIHEKLPVGTYVVKLNEMKGYYYLEPIANFRITGKVYGDTHKLASRILNTFEDRPYGTGVMLSGEKGSGKTLLAKQVSLNALEQGIPTIV